MHDDVAHVEARIRRTLRERIAPAVHGPGIRLDARALHVSGEPIDADVARSATYESCAVGDVWGPPWGTTWFRFAATVPTDWSGEAVDALIAFSPAGMAGFSAEALVWDDEGAVQGLHPEHQRVVVSERAAGGESVALLVEAAANPDFSVSFAPTALGDRATAGDAPLYRLARAEIAPRRRDVEQLDIDVRVLAGLMGTLPTDQPRRHDILRALERALDVLDQRDVPATTAAARAELAEVLASPAVSSAHRVSAIGHAHIDTAWLWPIRETRRKCARTFSTAVQLMDEYPEYRFGCSQAQQYAWMREDHPALFERIREKIATGQWVPIGGMWVEADANVPSGESLVRQFVHGQRFFLDHFGIECREGWIPDVFGYSAALPQIMRQAGCRWFVTQKMSWNETNPFPHHTFWWEGIDGSRVLTHFPPAATYNGEMKPAELARSVTQFRDHGRSQHSLYPFGHGDGGGGPTRSMLERARRLRDLEGAPRITIEAPADFFERVESEPEHPTWVGELYLEKHRGTYTSQAATKAGNRRAELALREAELWASAASESGGDYPGDSLDAAWKVLLTQQFHDILPGSSIAWVHRESEAALADVCARAGAIATQALATLVRDVDAALVLANALTHDRAEVVSIAPADEMQVPQSVGAQRLRAGGVAAWAEAPGMGIASLESGRAPDVVTVGERTLENSALRVTIGDDGTIASVVDLTAEREVLSAPANVLELFDDHPNEYDAWDIDRVALRHGEPILAVDSIEVIDRGPLIGRIRVRRTLGDSTIEQCVVLRAGSRRIDIENAVSWHESERMLKAAFPVDVHASSARFEIQHGYVERPTHENTSWDWARFEVCGHSWVDVSEPGYGVALCNDAKYGYDVHDGVVRLTLLRAPGFPDPQADRGDHRFTYALLPHVGDLRDGDVVAEAHRLNVPLRVVQTGRSGDSHHTQRVAHVDHPGVVVSAVKRADDGSGDLIVRAYESWGQRSRCRVGVEATIAGAHRCDLLERVQSDCALVDGHVALQLRPFELVTLRIRV